MGWWLVGFIVLLLLISVLVAILVVRARRQATARPDEFEELPEVRRSAALAKELRPSFATALERLRRAVKGVDFLYGVPWYLLVGPAGAGKTTLVAHARETALPRTASSVSPEGRDLAWHYFDGGVIIDVAASLAFPAGRNGDSGWRALLHLLKRYRPRRPVEGVLVAVPASLLLDESWRARTQDLGAAIRERLSLAQSELGFALPVYVIITQGDAVRGFSAFAHAVPESLSQGMLGWSSPRAADLAFQGEWVGEGIEALHRGIVHAQVELFASPAHLDDAADLLLFSGEIRQLAVPLRALLEEVFKPSVYDSSFFFRGFYLTGQAPDVALGGMDDRLSPGGAVSFLGDLLSRKVFPERGLATPLAGASIARNRSSLVAQVVAAVLAVVLVVGTAWTYDRFKDVRAKHQAFLTFIGTSLAQGTQEQKNARTEEDAARIERGFTVLERVEALSRENFRSIFFPVSIVSPFEPALADVLRSTFTHLVLPDFRAGLEHKGRAWLDEAVVTPSTERQDPIGPNLQDSARYRALVHFSQDYQRFVENDFRYVEASASDTGELGSLAGLGSYLTGRTVTFNVPELPYGRALREASSEPLNCSFAVDSKGESLVRRKASELLDDFGKSWFGEENPVRASQARFQEDWMALSVKGNGAIRALIAETKTLTQAASAWAAIGGRSGELRIPVLDQAPFKRLTAAEICEPLKPDLSTEIGMVASLRDGLTDQLLAVQVEPFGRLLKEGDHGLALDEGVTMLRTELEDLQHQGFWSALPVEEEGVLPQRATWRPEAIDDTVAVFDAFDKYRGRAFGTLDASARRTLLTAVRSEVAQGVATRLGLAATEGSAMPTETAPMLDEVARLDTVLTKMSRLVPLLADSQSPFGQEILRSLAQQSRDALQQLDREASARYPYLFAHRSEVVFSAWADVQRAAPAPADAVKRWTGLVDDQRETIRRFATQAQPLVQFLAATRNQSETLRRWSNITSDVSGFEQKLAGNGLATLDTFMRDEFPALAAEKDCATGGNTASARGANGAAASASFFVVARNDLFDDAVKRCRVQVQDRYAAVAAAFNRFLGGKFPFSTNVVGGPEPTPAQVVEFLKVYDRQDGRGLLSQLEARSCSADGVTFLRRVEGVYPLLAPGRDLPTPTMVLDVSPEFRVAQDREIGGDQIAQWQLDVGRQSVHDVTPEKPLRWTSGDPVTVQLRFARDSPSRPVAGDRLAKVVDRTVRFEFTGGWALFGLLRSGRAAPADLIGVRDPAPTVLRLEVPVERDPTRPPLSDISGSASAFKVYMRLRVFQPGKADNLAVDELPVEAPPQVSCAGA